MLDANAAKTLTNQTAERDVRDIIDGVMSHIAT